MIRFLGRARRACVSALIVLLSIGGSSLRADHVQELQAAAVTAGKADWGHWGASPEKYSTWTSHSNRLIPVYTFGINLRGIAGPASVYRRPDALEKIYGRLPEHTVNPAANYFDQTDAYRLQLAAATSGKKYIVLIVFDGMDWQTTWLAAIHRSGRVIYREGRGTGLAFQDYRGAPTDFGYYVTSPYSNGNEVDVNTQTVKNVAGDAFGGYDWQKGGSAPWATPTDLDYLIAKSADFKHAYTDSASSATSLTSGIKTYNASINVDPQGRQAETIAHKLQREGFAIGVLTSVPFSHATPAAAYAHNVLRDDYQDLTRDLVGLKSISHPQQPLPGVDVLLGGGWGENAKESKAQGDNFVPGNAYITDADLAAIDAASGGKYVTVQRRAGVLGAESLRLAAEDAAHRGLRLFGIFGAGGGHLPFETADGKFDPVPNGAGGQEKYTPLDVQENPTLADLTRAALTVLQRNPRGFWLMIESGDVDWANHANNIDNSIGAVLSGDRAFQAVVDWVEAHHAWSDTAVIVTADHGHYFFLDRPEALIPPQ